jgi:hypothetical protein
MLFTKTIRQLVALAMLVVFAFSITPQQVVHDIVAKHMDPTFCAVHKDVPVDQVENDKLHCTFDFQVATAPFVYYDFSIQIPALDPTEAQYAFYIAVAASAALQKNSNRGPPSLVNTIA